MQRLALIVVFVLLLGLPLPFGGVLPWCHIALQVLAFAALAMVVPGDQTINGWNRTRWPAGALATLAALGLLQSLAWPRWFVELVSPSHASLNDLVHPEATWIPLSLAPSATSFYSMTWLAVAALLVVSAAVSKRHPDNRLLLGGAMASLIFQILFGARIWLERSGSIWGLNVEASDRFRGTFINPDHFALYLEIMLTVLLAWGWWAIRRTRRFVSLDRKLLFIAPAVILWLTTFAVLAFTRSRAGILAAIVATVAQGLVLTARHRRWHGGAAGVLAPAVGLAVVASIGLQAGLGRWLGTSAADLAWSERLGAYAATLNLLHRFPVFGVGLASFREAFPMVQSPDLGGTWLHAHNDWLEIGVTMGALGWILLGLGVVTLLGGLGRVLQTAERSKNRALALAAIGACVAVMIHSCVDFGLSMPANAATLAILCGLALGADDQA